MVIRLLSPAQPDIFKKALENAERVLVVEQSYGAQFYRYLRGYFELDERANPFPNPDLYPFLPQCYVTNFKNGQLYE